VESPQRSHTSHLRMAVRVFGLQAFLVSTFSSRSAYTESCLWAQYLQH
jgi:hypothetical protein